MSSVGTFGSGAWSSFSHPLNALGGLSNDLTYLGSSAFNGNLSTLTAAWKAMDWDQRMRLISFQTSRVVGIGVTVSGLGGLYQLGSRAALGAYFGGKSLLQSVGRLALPKGTTTTLVESATQLTTTQSSISKGFILVGEGSLRSASVVRRGQTINRVFDSRWELNKSYSRPWGGSFSPGSSLPNSTSEAIIERGLNWPGVVNNARFGVVYKAEKNIPCMSRISLGGTTPEIEILSEYQLMFKQVGEYTQITP